MTTLSIPPYLVEQARNLGADIDPFIEYDPETPLIKLSGQFHGEETDFGSEDADMGCCPSTFGGIFGKLFKATGLKKVTEKALSKKAGKKITISNVKVNVKGTVKGLGNAAKTIGKVAAVASFVVPGVGPLVGGGALAAMASADKLLGDKNIKHAAKIVSNTKALAALGDPHARRGAVILGTVAKIRAVKSVPMGKKAIPYAGRPPTQKFTKVVTQAQANTLARAKVQSVSASRTAPAAKKSFWIKVKQWLGFRA
jgi:hypothetical protein